MTVSVLTATPSRVKVSVLIKRIVLLAIIFAMGLPGPVLAAEDGAGMIESQVINGTNDGISVSGQEITLKIDLSSAGVDSITAKTGIEGHFVLTGLSTEPGYSYRVALTFQQVDYASDWLSFTDGETGKFTDVIVCDSTTNDEPIKVMMSHTVIYVEPGSLSVTDYFLFVNDSDRTYIGLKKITGGVKEIMRFSLPEGITELRYHLGLMECCIYDSEDGFVEIMPLLPGGKEVAYSYRLNYDSGTYTFSRSVNYPTVSYNFLVQGETIKVASVQLTAEEPLVVENTLFTHLSGTDIASGDTIVVRLSGLPKTSNQGILVLIALSLIVLIFSFTYLQRKRKLQPVRAKVSADKSKFLAELAQLDDDFEDGKIKEDVYHRLRDKKKSQLVALIQRSEVRSGKR